jgi:hypothetical protein
MSLASGVPGRCASMEIAEESHAFRARRRRVVVTI